MKSRDWKDIAELIGITAIVASLLFVGFQIQQDQNIAIVETRSAITESAQTIAGLVQNNSEIWRRGLDGEKLDADDEIAFMAMVRAVRTHYFNLDIRWERFGHRDSQEVARRYAYALYIHPGLRNAFARNTEFVKQRNQAFKIRAREVVDGFGDSIKSNLKQLDKDVPPIPSRKEYVFWL